MTVVTVGLGSRTQSHTQVVITWLHAAVRWAAYWLFLATGSSPAAEVAGVSTEDLITRFQRGQPRAFEALFDRYKDYVYRVAFFTLRHREEAEEATQETFLDILKALPNYDINGPAQFKTWLYRVTVNRCKMRLRRKRPPSVEWDDLEERLERLPASHAERPESVVLERESAVLLWRAVNELPDDHRMTVLLRYRHELSYEEIAQVLGIKIGTVRSRLYNAHAKLKRWFGERH